MNLPEVLREIKEFLQKRREGTATIVDGLKLVRAIVALLLEVAAVDGPVFATSCAEELAVAECDCNDACDELGAPLAISTHMSAHGGPILDAILAAAIRALLEWLTKSRG